MAVGANRADLWRLARGEAGGSLAWFRRTTKDGYVEPTIAGNSALLPHVEGASCPEELAQILEITVLVRPARYHVHAQLSRLG
jgi:hypothetical protein